MTTLHFLKDQLLETRVFTKRLIAEMPHDLWFENMDNEQSNFAWQIGHITLAQNFHIISCAFDRDLSVFKRIPIQEHAKVFAGLGSHERSVKEEFISVPTLLDNMDFIFDLCIEKLDKASDDILLQALEPTPFKNPIAKNKYETIAWSYKHEMWHCAEMEHIKIQLGKQFQWIKK